MLFSRGIGVVAGVVAVAAVGLIALSLAYQGNFEGFLIVVPIGGLGVALLIRSTARRLPPQAAPDPFARAAFSTDTLNFAHVRVAGVGGFCLVLAVVTVALQYQITTAAVVLGLVGGALLGITLIRTRRRHGSDSAVPGSFR